MEKVLVRRTIYVVDGVQHQDFEKAAKAELSKFLEPLTGSYTNCADMADVMWEKRFEITNLLAVLQSGFQQDESARKHEEDELKDRLSGG